MQETIETKRLILRPFQKGDEVYMYELNNDPEVIRYTGDPPFESVEDARQFLCDYLQYCETNFCRWAVILKENEEFIGFCGLRQQENGDVDLGYRLKRTHWSKGLATEACLASIKHGFEAWQLDRIIGRVARANKASIRVLEKCGMTFWKSGPCEGIEDSLYYELYKARS